MIKIINKILFHLKNIMLPILLVATIYIVSLMFQRLSKDIFGENLIEFVQVILPFVILIILNLVNFVLNQTEVRDNFFYNATSFMVMGVIAIFCIRACFDDKMYFIHQYTQYNINFNYFADQIAPTKVMLYGLSFANVMLMISNYIKIDKDMITEKVVVDELKDYDKDETKKETKINRENLNKKMNKK